MTDIAGTSSPTPAAGPARRVLVVDDNVDSARGTALILKRHGHDVRLAYDGPAAVAAAAEYRPEFVLLDIGLPGMDGYEVARRLRAGREPRRGQAHRRVRLRAGERPAAFAGSRVRPAPRQAGRSGGVAGVVAVRWHEEEWVDA